MKTDTNAPAVFDGGAGAEVHTLSPGGALPPSRDLSGDENPRRKRLISAYNAAETAFESAEDKHQERIAASGKASAIAAATRLGISDLETQVRELQDEIDNSDTPRKAIPPVWDYLGLLCICALDIALVTDRLDELGLESSVLAACVFSIGGIAFAHSAGSALAHAVGGNNDA